MTRPRFTDSVFILFFILLSCRLAAQTNFQPGSYVTTGGDTVRGFIDQREWDQNPDWISFKTSLSSTTAQEMTYSDIVYFQTGEFAFEKHTVNMSMNAVDLSRPSTVGLAPDETRTVFLKILDTGPKVSLSSYRDKIKIRYFLSTLGKEPVELIRELRTLPAVGNNAGSTIVFEGYKQQLKGAAIEAGVTSDDLVWQIDRTTYGNDLAKIARLMNGNSKKKYKAENPWHPFAGAGLTVATVSYSGTSTFAKNATGDGPSNAPYFLVGVMYGRKTGKSPVDFAADLMYTSAKGSMHTFNHSGTSPVDIDYVFSQTMINFTLHLRWHIYNHDNFKAFVGTGLRLTTASYSENQYTISSGTTVTGTSEDFFKLSTFWPSFPVRAGVLIKKRFEISATYMLPVVLNQLHGEIVKEDISYLHAGVNVYLK